MSYLAMCIGYRWLTSIRSMFKFLKTISAKCANVGYTAYPPATCLSYDSDRRQSWLVFPGNWYEVQYCNTITQYPIQKQCHSADGKVHHHPSFILESCVDHTHIPNMREELVRCLLAIQQVGHTDCICCHCAEDLRKRSHSSEYVPVWKGG